MTSTGCRQQLPGSLKSLPPEEADRRLRTPELYFNQPERAPICVRCRYALKPSGETMSEHLCEKHQTSSEARYRLSAYVKTLRLTDPNELPLRQDGSEPPSHLFVLSGAECRQCRYQSASVKSIARHVPKVHDLRRRNVIGCMMRSWRICTYRAGHKTVLASTGMSTAELLQLCSVARIAHDADDGASTPCTSRKKNDLPRGVSRWHAMIRGSTTWSH